MKLIFPVRVLGFVLGLSALVVVTGCSSTRFSPSRTVAPEQLPPVASSNVQTSTLPPLGAEDGTIVTANPNDPFASNDPALVGAQPTNPDGSFVSLDDLPETTPSGRDLTGGVTVAKLLGTWTVTAGIDECRLNLTQTTKTGTKRYRASTPGCIIPALSSVASWQLAGSQIQLYDEAGAIIGSLLQSGNRFIGTLSGGVAVSMSG